LVSLLAWLTAEALVKKMLLAVRAALAAVTVAPFGRVSLLTTLARWGPQALIQFHLGVSLVLVAPSVVVVGWCGFPSTWTWPHVMSGGTWARKFASHFLSLSWRAISPGQSAR
jgi:hypothetical protein